MFELELTRTQNERTGDYTRPFVFNKSKEHRERVDAHCGYFQHDYFDSGLDKKEAMSSNVNKKDRLQVRAFYAVHKLLYDLTPEARLATAAVQTSNDVFAKADKALIRQWERNYG